MRTFIMPTSIHCTPAVQRLESRTEIQFEAVKAIVESPDFHYANFRGNLFSADVGSYIGPFCFTYTTKDGVLNTKLIGKNGKILRHVKAKSY